MVRKLLLLTAIGYSIALIIVSFINLYNVPKLGSGHDDKIYHVIAYLILGFFWMMYYKAKKVKYKTLIVILGLSTFGFVIEVLQHRLNPNRTFDYFDIVANCVGVLVGTLIAFRINIYKLK